MAEADGVAEEERAKPTRLQRMGMKELRRKAGKGEDEPLSSEDWEVLLRGHEAGFNRAMGKLFLALPRSPRCGVCGAPFAGLGQMIVGPLGFRPSRKNPHICATCVELSPPGGMKTQTGILFADLRGFTARFDGGDPEEASHVLRRFYRCAEEVLFPDAIIDKLIGDEVMALYLPELWRDYTREETPALMLEHACELLRAVGYAGDGEPFVQMGVGIDFGEAFVGNIGQRDVYDFTAVGDVVNTASRLQGEAAGGQIVVAERAGDLGPIEGERIVVDLKGKDQPVPARRITVAG